MQITASLSTRARESARCTDVRAAAACRARPVAPAGACGKASSSASSSASRSTIAASGYGTRDARTLDHPIAARDPSDSRETRSRRRRGRTTRGRSCWHSYAIAVQRTADAASRQSRTADSLAQRRAHVSRHELVERVGEPRRSGSVRGPADRRGSPEPVDPDRAEPELGRRRDVVKEALRDVDVALPGAPVCSRNDLPVTVRGLVRADLPRDDRELERDADRRHRRVDQIAVGVGEDREPPAPRLASVEPGGRVGEHRPARKRSRERARLALRKREAAPRPRAARARSSAPRDSSRPAFAAWISGSSSWYGASSSSPRSTPKSRSSSRADPAVPVHERPVAVERRPALQARKPTSRRVLFRDGLGPPAHARRLARRRGDLRGGHRDAGSRHSRRRRRPGARSTRDAREHRLVAVDDGRRRRLGGASRRSRARECYAGVAEDTVYVAAGTREAAESGGR